MSEQVRQRRALGRPRIVAAMQRLVPEPLDAAVVVGHRGSFYRGALTVGVTIMVAGFVRDQRSDLVSYLVVGTALYLALWTVGGVLVNASSRLSLGPWYGTLAVTDSTVYVARNSWWTGRPVAITATFPRVESTIVLGQIMWARRDLTVTLPDRRAVRLEAPLPITSAETRGAVASLGRPPEAEWRPDPGRPGQLRWWDGGDFSAITTRRPDPPYPL
jgi:hypothetical protein